MSNEPISNKSWADDILPTAQHRFFPGQSHDGYSNAGGGGHTSRFHCRSPTHRLPTQSITENLVGLKLYGPGAHTCYR